MAFLPTSLVLLLVACTAADWQSQCPDVCKCTYSNNRKVVDCRNAGFTTVPLTVSAETQELILSNSKIKYLEKDVFQKIRLCHLQLLDLSGNDIERVDKDAFRCLSITIELDLSRNRIPTLHPDTFSGMAKLRKLHLNKNLLERLTPYQFPRLLHLQQLRLSDCRLHYVNNLAFANLPNITSIHLNGNRLRSLQPEVFENRTKLNELRLHDNHWRCDCMLKRFVDWALDSHMASNEVTCHAPEYLAGQRWKSIPKEKFACMPNIIVPSSSVGVKLGTNVGLVCRAEGDPIPLVQWILHDRVLTNMSVIPFSQPERTYLIEDHLDKLSRWSRLTISQVSEDDLTVYTCLAENPAGLVERNVSLIEAESNLSGIKVQEDDLGLYVTFASIIAGILVLLLIVLAVCCFMRFHASHRSVRKENGIAEHKNIMVVNPVEKPPRHMNEYERLDQKDLEMAVLNDKASSAVEYVECPQTGMHRSPLATLDEENDEFPTQDTTLPLESSSGYTAHIPDLLDNTRFPRAVSPTQLSYHSLVYPPSAQEWRYSFVNSSEYGGIPSAYSPQAVVLPRPGYVTLPRRPRTPSWAGVSAHQQAALVHLEPVYDTLGPRTTADGTSRTDLTRPGSRLAIADPYTPLTPVSPSSPGHGALPIHCSPILEEPPHSSTLPRSTPNLFEGYALSLPAEIPGDPLRHPARAMSPSTVSSSSSVPHGAEHVDSPSFPLLSGKDSVSTNGSATILSHDSPAGPSYTSTKRKVPPKPPPKPSLQKRLSVTSTGSESCKTSLIPLNDRGFQEEGPDGTEV